MRATIGRGKSYNKNESQTMDRLRGYQGQARVTN